jgi:hypothetical protein
MSHRPIEDKKRRRVARQFHKTPPAFFNLIQYLIDRGHAKTRKQATAMLKDDRVLVDETPVGTSVENRLQKDMTLKPVRYVEPFLPVELRDRVNVLPADMVIVKA